MSKRYFIVVMFLIILVGCFFLFFDKPTNKELYTKYYKKIDSIKEFNDLSENEELNIEIDNEYISNQYQYVITFTSNSTLNNFKTLVVPFISSSEIYYPSFGIIDNKNINLVSNNASDDEAKGVNLVISNREKVESFKVYVSYNNDEYYYLINVGD